ncbi:hypothetical protein BOX15_Mlig022707g4 [Macrostomum lignano]|uniref:Glutamate receptor n=2 Tax=Macrostomum lignano TaxID=282301 RepID=A0A267DMQ9_9PLAT|nr:hypothetical protein BOX15_Mlig022707g4 [Macrostomum lignano]
MAFSLNRQVKVLISIWLFNCLSGCLEVGGATYNFALFWPQSGAAQKAHAQFQGLFRARLSRMCESRGVALPADFNVTFEEFPLRRNPSYGQLQSIAKRLRDSSNSSNLQFAGTTTVSLETRKLLSSLVAPQPLHWVDPPRLQDLAHGLFRIIRTMQRPDLAKAGFEENFASSPSTIDETKRLVIVVGHPYRLSEVQYLIRQFFYGVQCYSLDDTKISVIQYEVLQSKITTLLVLAGRDRLKSFLKIGLDGRLWSPNYRWILYNSGIIYDVKENLMPANSRNITSVEFGPYSAIESKYLSSTEDAMLYDLLNIWTVFMAHMSCGMPIDNLTVRALSGQFKITGNQSFARQNWQMAIYENLLTDSTVIGNFSTSGQFSMAVPKPRSSTREEVLDDYRKLNLSIFVITGTPYARFKEGMENRTDLPLKQRLEGLAFDLCMEVLANLGLYNFTVYIQEDSAYGSVDANGSWNGVVAALINGRADMACVDLTPNSARAEVIDFTEAYFSTNISILYKKIPPDATKEMFQFMFPLNTSTWFYLLGSMVIVAFVLAILHRISANNQHFDLQYSLFFLFASLVQGIVGHPPNRPSGRIVVSAYWLFVLVLLVAYVGNYAAMRVLARLQSEITTVVSLLDQSTYTYGTLANSSLSAFFKDSTFYDMRQVYASMRRFEYGLFANVSAAEAAVNTGTFAAIFDTTTNYYLQQTICDSVVTGQFENTATTFGVPRHSDLRHWIDLELQKLLSSGRPQELYKKYFIIPERLKPNCANHPLVGIIPTEPDSLKPPTGALTLQNTLGLLVINVIGCFLTLISATLERSWQSISKRRAKNKEESVPVKRRRSVTELLSRESRV